MLVHQGQAILKCGAGAQPPEVAAQADQRLGYLGPNAHQNCLRPQQPRGVGRIEQHLSELHIDNRHAGDIEDHGAGTALLDLPKYTDNEVFLQFDAQSARLEE